jgi:hypothetical protein
VTTIDFPDARAHADFATFVGRARRVAPDGAVRLQTVGGFLVMTVAVLEGEGLLGPGPVLGMRVVPATADAPVDATVTFASVFDRLARTGEEATRLPLPPTTVERGWAGMSPPRDGWQVLGALGAADLDRVAAAGVAEVAQGSPAEAGGHAVEQLRRRVWGRLSDTAPAIPSGLAFAAHALGFTAAGAEAKVAVSGRWTRISTPLGHVLTR